MSSSTASTGSPEGMVRVESGSVFSAMRAIVPSGADEQHVERHVGVLHPHRDRLDPLEVEQHAAVGRQAAAVHEALGAR